MINRRWWSRRFVICEVLFGYVPCSVLVHCSTYFHQMIKLSRQLGLPYHKFVLQWLLLQIFRGSNNHLVWIMFVFAVSVYCWVYCESGRSYFPLVEWFQSRLETIIIMITILLFVAELVKEVVANVRLLRKW